MDSLSGIIVISITLLIVLMPAESDPSGPNVFPGLKALGSATAHCRPFYLAP